MDPDDLMTGSIEPLDQPASPEAQNLLTTIDRASSNTPTSGQIQFQDFFNQSSDAMLVMNNEGKYIDVNSAACTLFGLPKQELLARLPTYFIESNLIKSGSTFNQAGTRCQWLHFNPHEPITGEFQLHMPNGAIRYVEYTGIANIAPQCHLAIARDISDRKQAELDKQRAIQRERFISAISQNIRQSLSLDYILNTTVEEVQQFLQVDRVLICRFNPNGSGKVVAEALEDESFSMIDRVIDDPCFVGSMLPLYQQGQIHTISDVLTADLDPGYIKTLTELQVRAVLVIPILVRQHLWGLLIAHQCTSSRQWQQLDEQLLQQFCTQVAITVHQAELYQQVHQQAQREQVLNRVTQSIRNSLNLPTIFSTAVAEIGNTLRVDRASIVQYLHERQLWQTVASYCRDPKTSSTLGLKIPDADNPLAAQLKRFEIVRLDDTSLCTDKVNQRLAQELPGAWLLVPLQIDLNQADGQSKFVWGSLSLVKSYPCLPWQESEVELACAIADQLSIAIQQSELFQQVQQLNCQLGKLVEEQTDQLQTALEFEALLKRITDKVRDSLDEAQILQTVLRELVQGLEISGCDVALHDLDRQISVIRYEHISEEIPSAQGRTVSLQSLGETFSQLYHGITFQFCQLLPDATRPVQKQFAILDCPIIDDQNVLGDLWLFRSSKDLFSEEEIRLVQQVANQCAIAIRQARLYEAAQAQVSELERLNRLKDDFLSTVSHELRSPITSIKMATKMLEISFNKLGILESGSVGRYFQILEDESQREISLINDLLDLCRLDAAKEPLSPIAIDLPSWMPSMVAPFIERANSQQQQLTLNLSAQLPKLVTNLPGLERILTELLTNACKYTPPGETISISVQAIAQMIQIKVTNSGVEIPVSERSLIFDKFYRIPNSDPWRHGGTGLGLALVKKLVEQIGALIEVEGSKGQTSFTVSMPIASSQTELG